MRQSTPAERAKGAGPGQGPPVAARRVVPPPDRTDPLEILALQATTRSPTSSPSATAGWRRRRSPSTGGRRGDGGRSGQRGPLRTRRAVVRGRPPLQLRCVRLARARHDLRRQRLRRDHPGPFEWDLKRLAASFEIAARSREFDDDPRDVSRRPPLVFLPPGLQRVRRHEGPATSGTPASTSRVWWTSGEARPAPRSPGISSARLQGPVQGPPGRAGQAHHRGRRPATVHQDPPLMVPAGDCSTTLVSNHTIDHLFHGLSDYRHTLSGDRQHLLDSYEFVDLARKVVGVGAWARAAGWPCSWAATRPTPCSSRSSKPSSRRRAVPGGKSARQSGPTGGGRPTAHAELQRHLPRVGPLAGDDGVLRDFYLRQLWDCKLSADIDSMPPAGMGSTHRCADGRWPGPMPAPVTPSPWVLSGSR